MKKIIKKSMKRGFTLLELMLVIAIILLISGVFVTMLITIKNSFRTVYNQNDSADYSMLFARGFEQAFISAVYHDTGDTKNEFNVESSGGEYKLCMNGNPVFEPTQNKAKGGSVDKWKIDMGYKWDPSNRMVYYKIYVWDNYYESEKITYIYSSGFMLPHYSENLGKIETSGSAILAAGEEGYKAGDEDYLSKITFTPKQ